MQLISLIVFRTDTWKRMVIRDIIIFLVSGAASVGRIQEDTTLMRLQKGSSMITASRQYRESSSVQSFLSTSADHRTRSTHLSREMHIVLKKKNRYSMRSGTGFTNRSHVREAVSRQRWSMPKTVKTRWWHIFWSIIQVKICQMNSLRHWLRGAKKFKMFAKIKM